MAITVAELIEQLGYMDQDAEVHFQYNYGDHWRTQVAPGVDTVEEGVVKYSDYHRMDKVVDEDDFDYDDDGEPTYGDNVKKVVLIG